MYHTEGLGMRLKWTTETRELWSHSNMDVKQIKFCYNARTKSKISSNVLSPKKWPQMPSQSIKLLKILGKHASTPTYLNSICYCTHSGTSTGSQTNAILLPQGLIYNDLALAFTNPFLCHMSCITDTIKCTCGNSNLRPAWLNISWVSLLSHYINTA